MFISVEFMDVTYIGNRFQFSSQSEVSHELNPVRICKLLNIERECLLTPAH